eukprot:9486988-Pyramimonas_sp.AAC.2
MSAVGGQHLHFVTSESVSFDPPRLSPPPNGDAFSYGIDIWSIASPWRLVSPWGPCSFLSSSSLTSRRRRGASSSSLFNRIMVSSNVSRGSDFSCSEGGFTSSATNSGPAPSSSHCLASAELSAMERPRQWPTRPRERRENA